LSWKLAAQLEGWGGPQVLTSDGIENLSDYPRSMVIVGAGVVGCEFATIFSNFGKTKVYIIDRAPRILPFEDADILIYMVEIGEQELKDEAFFNKIIHSKIPVLLLLNKIDNSNQEQLETQVAFWTEKVPNAEIYPISALQNFNVPEVFQRIISLLPESPAYYPKDQLTDKPERFFVNETIREKILLNYSKEIPYAVEIVTEEFFEDENIIRIRSLIMVERETQKGIIIGHKGAALKKVGVDSRADLEKFFGKQIHIELYVKVNKNWRSNANMLKRFGYNQ
jgi:GTP-binding protein Era